MRIGTAGTSISSSSAPISSISSSESVGALIFPERRISGGIPSSASEIRLSYRNNHTHNLHSIRGGGSGVGEGIGIMATLMTNGTTITNDLSGVGSGGGFSDFGGEIDTTDFDHHYNSMDLSSMLATTTAPTAALDSADDLFRDYDFALTQLAAVFCVIFIILGVPGNLITIIALARCKKVRNATAYFIINLSACDLMFCCFNLPLSASMFWNRRWVHGDTLCRLFPLFRYGLMAVSIFTVLAITINRYVMIGHPRVYPRYLGVMILLIWLGSFGALVPTLFGIWGKFDLDKQIGSCSILPDENGRSPKSFLFTIAFLLPCCAIIICYARIFCIMRKATANLRPVEIRPSSAIGNVNHSLETESLSPTDQATILRRTSARPSMAVIHQKGKMSNKDRKLLWMILVIFGTFVVCYLPITIFKAVFVHKNSTWNIFGYILIYMTTLVYVLMSSDYRQAYTNLFLCRKDWNLSSRTSNSNKT